MPGFVVAPTFYVHDTTPSEPAVGVALRPAAADTVPDGQVTLAEQVAPGSVFAVIDAVEPGMAVSWQAREPNRQRGRCPTRGWHWRLAIGWFSTIVLALMSIVLVYSFIVPLG